MICQFIIFCDCIITFLYILSGDIVQLHPCYIAGNTITLSVISFSDLKSNLARENVYLMICIQNK